MALHKLPEGTADDVDLFKILADFNLGMSNFDISSPIKAFVIDVLGSRGMERATEKFLALLTENVGVLPEGIGHLLSSANWTGQDRQ